MCRPRWGQRQAAEHLGDRSLGGKAVTFAKGGVVPSACLAGEVELGGGHGLRGLPLSGLRGAWSEVGGWIPGDCGLLTEQALRAATLTRAPGAQKPVCFGALVVRGRGLPKISEMPLPDGCVTARGRKRRGCSFLLGAGKGREKRGVGVGARAGEHPISGRASGGW